METIIDKQTMLKETMVKALNVALFVGTVLLLINQFDALFGPSKLRVIPAVLTYCVPFIVFIAGRLSNKESHKQRNKLD